MHFYIKIMFHISVLEAIWMFLNATVNIVKSTSFKNMFHDATMFYILLFWYITYNFSTFFNLTKKLGRRERWRVFLLYFGELQNQYKTCFKQLFYSLVTFKHPVIYHKDHTNTSFSRIFHWMVEGSLPGSLF